jgi:hypothetical protein
MRFIGPLAIIALLSSASFAHAGPCTAEIAQIQQHMNAGNTSVAAGPSAPQTIGAQLGRQPTPATVQSAERQASAFAQAALDNVRKADTAGNTAACREALAQFKDLYGLP